MKTHTFSLSALLDQVNATMQSLAEQQEVELIFPHKTSHLPLFIQGDELKLRQVLINLVSNSLTSTHKGEVVVTVSAIVKNGDQTELHFRVKESSIAREFGGSDRGLAISKELVKMMGGSIWFEKNRERGATFHFTVVCGITESSTLPFHDKDNSPAISDCKILLVEDNIINRELANHFLKRQKHHVILAHHGLEALEILADQNHFDLIFMDIQMPVMDGLTAASIIRAGEKGAIPDEFGLTENLIKKLIQRLHNNHISIVAMTANAMKGDKQKCIESGMDGYLTKPFDQDQILQTISTLLRDKINPGKDAEPTLVKQEEVHSQVKKPPLAQKHLTETVYNHLKSTYKLADGDIDRFFRLSRNSLKEGLAKAQVSANSGDSKSVRKMAHSLKGSLLNLGLHEFAAIAQEIERGCKQENHQLCCKKLITLQKKLEPLFGENQNE